MEIKEKIDNIENEDNLTKNLNMILTLRLCKNKDSGKRDNLFYYNNIIGKHTFRISKNGLLIRKKDVFKFIPMNIDGYYDHNILLCSDEIGLAWININKRVQNNIRKPRDACYDKIEDNFSGRLICQNFITHLKEPYKSKIVLGEDGEKKISGIHRSNSTFNPDLDSKDILWRDLSRINKCKLVNNMASNKIEKNDLIKFGNVKFVVSDFLSKNQFFHSDNITQKSGIFNIGKKDADMFELSDRKNNFKDNIINNSIFNLKNLDSDVNNNLSTCRICYSNHCIEEDPLISMCNCTGSVKYIHYICLQKWLMTSLKIKERKSVTTIRCKLNCEICKAPLPTKFIFKKRLYKVIEEILNLQSLRDDCIKDNYYLITLESIDYKCDDHYLYMYIITTKEGHDIKIGSSKECDVVVKDNTIDNVHCILTCFENDIYVVGVKSKFRTYVLEKKPLEITNDPLSFQLGNSHMTAYFKDDSLPYNLNYKNPENKIFFEKSLDQAKYFSAQNHLIITAFPKYTESKQKMIY